MRGLCPDQNTSTTVHIYNSSPPFAILKQTPLLSFLFTPPPSLLLLPPESWVEVGEGQVEGALVHNQSQEKMEQLLADAASEEELSDTDQL